MTERAVITGAAAVTALGADLETTWDRLCAGASGVGPVPGFDAATFPCAVAGHVELPPISGARLSPRDESLLGRHGAMLLHAARHALADAGIDPELEQLEDTGFFAAMAAVDPALGDLEKAVAIARAPGGIDLDLFVANGYQRIHPLWPLSMLNNVAFCIVSATLGVRGENAVFSSGADGVVAALAEACALVTEGRGPRALVAGVSAALSPMGLARVHLEAADGRPQVPRPPGEGCAVLVVENEAVVRSRGVRVRAVAAGWSSLFSSCHGSPDEAMRQAVAVAGLRASDLDLVMLHAGPSVRAAEDERAVVRLFLDQGVGAVVDAKGAIGHLGAGAGAVDLCLALRALEGGTVPGSQLALPRRKEAADGGARALRSALVNANGASGQRAAAVLTRAVG